MAKVFFIKDKIVDHFNIHKKYYYFSIISFIVGLLIGLILSFTEYAYMSLLNSSDNIIFDYITGEASYLSIFYSRIKDICLCVLIIFILNITIYTSFLSYIFVGYQMCLLVLSCAALIIMYGFSGILNVILIMLPINILNYFILNIINSLCVGRASRQRRFKESFFSSFKGNDYFVSFCICLLVILVLCAFNCFVMPLFIKSFVVINY